MCFLCVLIAVGLVGSAFFRLYVQIWNDLDPLTRTLQKE